MKKYIILIGLFTSVQFWAQESMTLPKAIAIGLENNFAIKISDKNIEIADNNNSWAMAGKTPTLDLNGTFSNSYTNDNNPASFLQGAFYNGSLGGTLDAQWLVLNGGRVRILKNQFESLADQERLSRDQQIHDLLRDIATQYYGVILQEERLEALREIFELSKDRFAYEQTKKEYGASNSYNLIQFKNNIVSDSTNLINQEIQIEITKRDFYQLLDMIDLVEYSFDEKLITLPETMDREALQEKLTEENYTLKTLIILQGLSQLNSQLEESARKPTLAITGSLGFSENGFKFFADNPNTGDPFEFIFSNRFNARLGANLNWNLYDGGVIKTNIKNAKIQEEINQLSYLDAQAELSTQLDILLSNYNNQIELVKLSETQFSLSEENLLMTEERFKAGQVSSLDYRNVQNQLLNATFNKVNTVYQLILAKIDIDYLVGSFEEVEE